MEELLTYRQLLLERYAAIVEDLAVAAESIPESARHQALAGMSWSVHHVLAHLRASEERAFLKPMQRIVSEKDPLIDRFDASQWMEKHYRPDEPLEEIQAGYAGLRRMQMELIINLPADGWNRTGYHPTWGRRTLQWWLEHSLAHAEAHLRQFNRRSSDDLI